jgi:seryl-tRNA synthetase
MKNLPTLKTTSLPSVDVTYGALDFIGNTVGRYFDYKRDTSMIKHETEKVHAQAKIVVKKIDAELVKSLDNNEKSFKKEMKRLKIIAKSLEENSGNKKKILKHIIELTEKLSDTDVPLSVKENIPQLMMMAHNSLAQENDQSLQKLNLMQGFDPDTKLIGAK